MFAVKYDAVFVVINVRRILESPAASLDRDRDDAVVLSCRMVGTSGIAFVFHAELTFWIGSGFRFSCSGNRFRIFFRFGKIDRNVKCAVFGFDCPFSIFFDAVAADIVTVLT